MKIFAVLGDPVAHSISPLLHNKALLDLGINAAYVRFCLKNGSEIISKFKELKLSGANVTLPHKEWALKLSDEASSTAKAIGSANTLVLKNDKIHAYNTDALGFFKSISDFGKISSALLIGAGGTAKAISYILNQNGIRVEILNRSDEKLADFRQNFECFSWQNFTPKSYDLVINSTSAGLKDELLPAPLEILLPVLKQSKFAFDVIYGKKTPFLNLSKDCNLASKDGLGMLIFQAVLAFNLFFNEQFSQADIEKSMRSVI